MEQLVPKRPSKGKTKELKEESGAEEPQKLEGQKNCSGSTESKTKPLVAPS